MMKRQKCLSVVSDYSEETGIVGGMRVGRGVSIYACCIYQAQVQYVI